MAGSPDCEYGAGETEGRVIRVSWERVRVGNNESEASPGLGWEVGAGIN